MAEHKKTALVTGASSGLGAEFCRQLATRCDTVIAVARRADRLRELARELGGQADVHCLAADLTSIEGVHATLEVLRQRGPVDYLVNNAGFGTSGHFDTLPLDGQRSMVALHIDASLSLCRGAIPFMRERGGGAIINVSSLGSWMPGAGLAVYGATKAFLNCFSIALQAELIDAGIEVQALCPGFTRTGFHDAMSGHGFERDQIPPEMWMEPAAVVAASLSALGSGRVLVIPGEGNVALARAALEKQLADLEG